MYLVNFSNQVAAGPKNIANIFIRHALGSNLEFIFIVPSLPEFMVYENTAKCRFIVVDVDPGSIKSLLNVFKVNLIVINRLVKKYRPKAILAFGNFLFGISSSARKIVLLHHPYIVDDRLYSELDLRARLSEFIKRKLFAITVKECDCVVVQSEYMEKQLSLNHDCLSRIIFNPISDKFKLNGSEKLGFPESDDLKRLIYVSRYYPHKNHGFLIELAREIKANRLPIVIDVTVDESILDSKSFLSIIRDENLPINNLGEMPQEKLAHYYENVAFAAIFPSSSETFGNPLVEAMFFSLPVIAPNLEYAESILGNAGIIYNEDNVQDCLDKIKNLFDSEKYSLAVIASSKRALSFPKSQEWYDSYVSLLDMVDR